MWLFTFVGGGRVPAGRARGAVGTLLLNAITLAAIGFMVMANALPWQDKWPVTPSRWWVLAVYVVMLNALVASAVAFAFLAISNALAKEGEAKALLEQANQSLREEVRQRTAAEAALSESEQRYRPAFTTNSDAININKMDGTYIDRYQPGLHRPDQVLPPRRSSAGPPAR